MSDGGQATKNQRPHVPSRGRIPFYWEEREVKKGLGKRAGRRRRTENAQELRVRCAKHICRASW